MKRRSGLFSAEKIIDFIFGISHSDDSQSAYGLTLYLHLLNLSHYNTRTINYIAYSYPQFSLQAAQANNTENLNKPESKLTDAKPPLSPVKKIGSSKVFKITIASDQS